MKHKFNVVRQVGPFCLVLVGLAAIAVSLTAPAQEGGYVGSETCAECHDEVAVNGSRKARHSGDATVEQRNTNPAPPLDLGKPDTPPVGVALAFDFPDQENIYISVEAKYQRRLSAPTTIGVLYIFEDWDLDDFQLQQLQAYGANFLTVDDATRYTFLDSWYGTFDAHVGQVFVKLSF